MHSHARFFSGQREREWKRERERETSSFWRKRFPSSFVRFLVLTPISRLLHFASFLPASLFPSPKTAPSRRSNFIFFFFGLVWMRKAPGNALPPVATAEFKSTDIPPPLCPNSQELKGFFFTFSFLLVKVLIGFSPPPTNCIFSLPSSFPNSLHPRNLLISSQFIRKVLSPSFSFFPREPPFFFPLSHLSFPQSSQIFPTATVLHSPPPPPPFSPPQSYFPDIM